MPSKSTQKRHVRYDCPHCGKTNTDMTEVQKFENGRLVSSVTTCDNCDKEVRPT